MTGYRWLVAGAMVAFGTSCTGGSSPPQTQSNAVTLGTPPVAPLEKIKAMPVEAAKTPPAPNTNPFQGAHFYIDPDYTKKVMATAAAVPAKAELCKKVATQPTALWLDSIAAVASISGKLDDVAKKKGADGQPAVPVFVVYDMPNRDCSAKSSAGELDAFKDGEARYRTEFIDAIAKQFAAHPSERIVAIIEPDSLPNLATNLDIPKCKASEDVYRNSTAYAIAKLSLPNVYLYLDAAHAGWLGWDGNRQGAAEVFKQVLDMAGGVDRIRGFATNVSNYTPIDGEIGKKLEPSNPCGNEVCYVQKFAETLAKVGITNKGFIIDTSRNGRHDIRKKWGSWCNVQGAGLGERPRVSPQPLIDAYFWVKPPGDSDGVADSNQPRFDAMCAGPDSTPGAPQAGQWFQSYFIQLMDNAQPPL